MSQKFPFVLEGPNSFHRFAGSEGSIENYIDEIVKHSKVNKKEFYQKLNEIIPDYINIEVRNDLGYDYIYIYKSRYSSRGFK